jgi:hypothetical protein
MVIVVLLTFVAMILTLCKVVAHVPLLGQLLVPSPWLLAVIGVIFVTWLLHE